VCAEYVRENRIERDVGFVCAASHTTSDFQFRLANRGWLHSDQLDAVEAIRSRLPNISQKLADSVVAAVQKLRAMELKKAPSISETLDWAQTLLELGLDTLDESVMRSTLGVVLKQFSGSSCGGSAVGGSTTTVAESVVGTSVLACSATGASTGS